MRFSRKSVQVYIDDAKHYAKRGAATVLDLVIVDCARCGKQYVDYRPRVVRDARCRRCGARSLRRPRRFEYIFRLDPMYGQIPRTIQVMVHEQNPGIPLAQRVAMEINATRRRQEWR